MTTGQILLAMLLDSLDYFGSQAVSGWQYMLCGLIIAEIQVPIIEPGMEAEQSRMRNLSCFR